MLTERTMAEILERALQRHATGQQMRDLAHIPLSVRMCEDVHREVRKAFHDTFRNQAPESIVKNLLMRLEPETHDREGLKDTPRRVVKSWQEHFAGYGQDVAAIIKTFEDGGTGYDEMVVEKDIDFYSHCEHHIAPFYGRAHVAYLPNGKVVGLSKMGRLVDVFAKRLQVQERLTVEIRDAMDKHLSSKGTAVVVEAVHSCMSCRGVKKVNAKTVTSSLSGAFKADPSTRAEFFQLIRSGK